MNAIIEPKLKVTLSDSAKDEIKKALDSIVLILKEDGQRLEAKMEVYIQEFEAEDYEHRLEYNQYSGEFTQEWH